MTTNLKNKTVLITGASTGIGEACAYQCAAAGANLILIARRAQKLQDLVANLKSKYKVNILTLILDIRDKIAITEACKQLSSEWANIDILINNAGVALGKDKFQDAAMDDLETMIDTNIKGTLFLTKNILPLMLARNQGHIVNIGSIAGHEVYPGGATYCATKFAIGAFTDGLKKDLLGTAIRVNLISPGMVKTDLSRVRFKDDQEKVDAVYANMTPLSATDIAETVLFCVTRAAHVNISEIVVLPTDQASTTMVHRNK
jgi:3-hydroxy acid dehydrogenase/malonic semialdehyde reductase